MTRSPEQQRAFDEWKAKALTADILSEAVARGAKLRRAGKEQVGPCPACGGTDRFSINPAKRIFNCRGAEGGDVIKMVEHIDCISFMQAIEALTGDPPPRGRAQPLSDEQRAERQRRREESDAIQRQRAAQQAAYEADTQESAVAIWNACRPIAGTLAETYLGERGIPVPLPGGMPLGFHPAATYRDKGKMPVLVCRVDDALGDITAVWRIFLRPDGSGKADVENAKLGLGPAGGGAVRIGGIGPKIGLAEGVETALGAWMLIGQKYPVWAALSTSGMIGFEVPFGVERVIIFPDGDYPMKRQGDEYVTAVPAGRKAAQALKADLIKEGIACVIAAEPSAGSDYLDLWNAHQREDA